MRFYGEDISKFLKTNTSRGLGKTLMIELFNEVFSVIFKDGKKFKFMVFNNQTGVVENINGVNRWSWLNTLNTHYTSLEYLFNHLVSLGYKFKDNPFSFSNCHNTRRTLQNALLERGVEIFSPGSVVMKDLYFMTQNTWVTSLVSVMNTYIILQNHNINFDINELHFERGKKEDFNGVDFNVQIDGKNYRTQHKKTSNVTIEDDRYVIPYIDSTYIKNVDLFIIDNNFKLFIFKKENVIIEDKKTIFKKENLIMEIMKEKDEVSELMNKIFINANMKRIVFEMNKNTDGTNTFIQNEKMIILNIGDPLDTKLPEKLKEILSKL